MDPEHLVEADCAMGECPRWDATTDRLYWCDMLDGAMYRYDPSSDDTTEVYDGPNVGGFVLGRDGTRLLFREDGTIARHHDDGRVETLDATLPDDAAPRFHDALVDSTGRVLCGTIPTDDDPSRVYRLDHDGTARPLITDVGIANGIGLSPDGHRLYLADTDRDRVDAFAYDPETGTTEDRSRLVDVAANAGAPDGLAVDVDGHVWLAHTGGSRLVRYAPDGTETDVVEFPVSTVTSVEFGGPDRTRAYVTTGTDQDARTPDPLAGALFGFDVDVPGVARNTATIDL